MIDQSKLNSLSIHPANWGQKIFGSLILKANYRLPGKRTEILLEGRENIPANGGAVYVMNHTDRFNYWPFQFQLWQEGKGFVSPWVKGKYYENLVMSWFLDRCNNIPVPSKGYVLTKDFMQAAGRPPSNEEYSTLKKLIDGTLTQAQAAQGGSAEIRKLLSAENYADSLELRFEAMMKRLVELSQQALTQGMSILIFPQGTRSKHLLPGHTGAAQFVLHSGAPVIPVGCNGSDRAYPGSIPLSRGGMITYRIGKPLTKEGALKPFQPDASFTPFTREAEKYSTQFQGATELFMQRINELLDPEYQFSKEVGGTQGVNRFV